MLFWPRMERPSRIALALLVFAWPLVSAAAEPTRRALLIGINAYLAVPSLNGAVNDVEMIHDILTTRFGFPPEEIEVVTDRDATREGVLAAIRRLADRSGPDDVVYLHYSGHGSQLPDNNGDEADGQDETLVTHDGRTGDVADITDDELAELIASIRGRSVVVTLDSCHAGTATRAANAVRARTMPPDTRMELYTRLATRAIVPMQPQHLLLAGAADSEQALDGPVDGRSHGLFSYALARSLASAGAEATPRAVFRGVGRELERIKAQLGLASMPQPQLEAREERLQQAIFPRVDAPAPVAAPELPVAVAPEEARLPWVGVNPVASGSVVLVGGTRLGALPGSTWAIYGPGEREFAPGAARAEADVTEVSGSDAFAALSPADAVIEPGSRAIALSPAPVADGVAVRLVDADTARRERVRTAIAGQLPGVAFVGEERFARFVVELEAQRCRVFGADGSFEITSFPIDGGAEGETRLAASLAALFARSMNAAELLAIDNPAAQLDLELEVVGQTATASMPAATEGRAILVSSTEAQRYRIRREGDSRTSENSLQLRVRSSEECSLLLVDVDSEGGVRVLFPNPLSEAKAFLPGGRIPAGEAVQIPDSLDSGNRAGFYFDYAPPAGIDTVRAFCFLDPRVAGLTAESIASLDAEAAATGTRGGVRRVLMERLRPALDRVASRGIVVVANAPETPPSDPEPALESAPTEPPPAEIVRSDWAAAAVTVTVEE